MILCKLFRFNQSVHACQKFQMLKFQKSADQRRLTSLAHSQVTSLWITTLANMQFI